MCRATAKNTVKERHLIDIYNNHSFSFIYEMNKKLRLSERALYDYYSSECSRIGGHDFRVFSYAFHIAYAYVLKKNVLVVILPTRKIFIQCETN